MVISAELLPMSAARVLIVQPPLVFQADLLHWHSEARVRRPPTVSGATFTVPGSTARLQVTTNFSSNANYSDIVMTFSAFVTNVSFRIVDIDKNTPGSTTYFDRVTISGSNGSITLNATITKYVIARVTDATGRIVQSAIRTLYKGNNNISISNLTKLNPGVYIIEVFDEERKSLGISRLIKN
jgi:hypothetical protein